MARGILTALMAWCGTVMMFGLVLAGAGLAATDGFARFAFGLLGHGPIVFTPDLRFAVALMGAVTLGWGMTLAAVVSVAPGLPADVAPVLWRRVTLSLLAWFVVDSSLSIATGFGLNAVSNLVLLATFLAIVWRGRLLR